MSQFYGHNGYAELKPASSWDPRRGWTIIRRYKGVQAAIDALAVTLINAGVRFSREVMPDGGYHILNATYGAEETQPPNEALSDLWDLDGNDFEKSLWLKPEIRNVLQKYIDPDGTPSSIYLEVRADIAAIAAGEKYGADVYWWGKPGTVFTPQELTTIKRFVAALILGVDSYHLSAWVLRRRRVIASNSIIKPSNSYVNMIFQSTAGLMAIEGVPTNLAFDLPNGIWLKKSPKRSQIAADKWEISQEYYWADEYSDFAYATVPGS